MEKHRLALLLSLLISTCFCVIADDSGQSDDEPSPNTLGSIGSKDSIQIITPGPTVDPDAVLTLRVDPEKPGIPEVSNEYTVGSVGGAVSVGSMGAAVYEMPIECPEGRLNPSIGLVYNSQNMNYGLAGFGFSLSGLSVITRGEKTIFNNNGEIGGVGGEPDDFLYLDGKRLILMSGTAGKPGAEYCLEGDPHTRIIIHSTFNDSSNNIWFEVQTPDGKVYQYGCSPNSQISYKDDNGEERFVSWYIGQAEDIYGNYITYIYNVKDYYAYPLYVLYGNNYILNRGVSNKVVFEYRDLGANATYFRIGNKQGKIDQSIKSITTLSNETVFRKYQLDYDDTSDHSTGKFSRLVSIRKQNGHGESMPPTQFTWSHIPENAQKSSSLYLSTDSGSDLVKEESKVFFAADVTGDGVSDIVRVAPVKVTTAIGNGSSSWSNETWVYVSRSVVGEGNKVSYQSPLVYNLPKPYMTDHSQFNMGGSYLMDIDGDGYNDIIIPYHDYEKDKTNYAVMYCVLGRDVVAGRDRRSNRFVIKLDNAKELPLFVSFDEDKDGRDELLYVEKDATSDNKNKYIAGVVHYTDGQRIDKQTFIVTLDSEPQKIFSGDFNNDGLIDILLLHQNGYKIYFNNGGAELAAKYSESNIREGTDIKDQWRVQTGDFDGDGLIDLVYYSTGDKCLWTALNNGDGTFSLEQSDNIYMGEHATNKDNSRFTILVYDADGDGRSDVYLCKSNYVHRGFPQFKNEYTGTYSEWLYSDGRALRLKNKVDKSREDDAKEGTIFVGDFNGNGQIELANYGSRLDSSEDNDLVQGKIYVYKGTSASAQIGRITSVTDGLGNRTDVEYANLTDPAVYSRTESSENTYSVNAYTLPISVVKTLKSTNGVAGRRCEEFRYKDLKVHLRGAGVLGFEEITKTNTTTGQQVSTAVTARDDEYLIPTTIKVTSKLGGKTSTSVSTIKVEKVAPTYFAYDSESVITDMDGNTVRTVSHFDKAKGVILDRTVYNDGDNMYKKVAYSGYVKKGRSWRPTVMKKTQKHPDDDESYTNETRYNYNDKGDILTTITGYGTPMALTTTSTYDALGNCSSVCTSGKGVKQVTGFSDYDDSGRFLVKSYTSPASSILTYTYDMWGNVLTENDISDPGNTLTTTHSYDNWGKLASTQAPDGTITTYRYGWGDSEGKKYYNFTSTSGEPWVLTWYDAAGHETRNETFGQMNVLIAKATSYNSLGLVSEVVSYEGKFKMTESYTYDSFGRVVADVLSTGKETTYSYGNRSVSVASNGRTNTRITDAWGNIVKSRDAMDGEVVYRYGSNGLPCSVTSHGATVTMQYDEAGNRTVLNDPDAGCITSEFSADGRLLRQTDARGVETKNTYDSMGRLVEMRIGDNVITNTYGTAGNDLLRLKKRSMGDKSIEYSYDRYGRVSAVERRYDESTTIGFAYQYDQNNRLSKMIYPGGLEVDYDYNDYGFTTEVSAAGFSLFKAKEFDGLMSKSNFYGDITFTRECDAKGFETSRELSGGLRIFNVDDFVSGPLDPVHPLSLDPSAVKIGKTVDKLDSEFDCLTGNLLSRKRKDADTELFGYDELDRLVSAQLKTDDDDDVSISNIMGVDYAANGNIEFKTGIGRYTYNDAFRPHAVMEVENEADRIPSRKLLTAFNDLNYIDVIEDEEARLKMLFDYGPDLQRWHSVVKSGGRDSISTLYAGNYEVVTENGRKREFYYLDGSTIIIREDGEFKPYFAFTDHLGSIVSVADTMGVKVFEANYDPWGVQTIVKNEIGLRRGYTGHEMLNEFGIINMNGRLYDPTLGRFFSPDPFVQAPDMSQAFNRYSYCFNNPLKYTDPSGNISMGVVAFALFNAANSMMQASISGDNVLKAGALSLLSSAATYGIGQAFGAMGSIGHELLRAGAHGISGGLFNVLGGGNFGAGFASGAISSGSGSLAQHLNCTLSGMTLISTASGAVTAWISGDGFLQGAMRGLSIATLNHGLHYDTFYTDSNGEYHYAYSRELICTPQVNGISYEAPAYYMLDGIITIASDFNTVVADFGTSLEYNSGNSTIGNNGKLYFHGAGERGFYGNQYVKVTRLTTVGQKIGKVTGPIGQFSTIATISDAMSQDLREYYDYGSSNFYQSTKAISEAAGSSVGFKVGMEIGVKLGACIGAAIGGAGAVPGALIGGFVGGVAGSFAGEWLASKSIDYVYGY